MSEQIYTYVPCKLCNLRSKIQEDSLPSIQDVVNFIDLLSEEDGLSKQFKWDLATVNRALLTIMWEQED